MIPTLHPFQLDAVSNTAEAARKGAKVIILCSPTGSGKTTMGCDIVRRAIGKERRVLEIVHRRRLVDQFSQRLIEFQIDHGVFMRGHTRERECRVQVASRDTLLSRCLQNEWEGMPPADLVIVDEGRHAAAPEFRKMLKFYEDRKALILLLDATPVMPDGRGLGPWAQSLIVAAKVTDLVRDGYLVPVKCYAPERKKLKNGKISKRGIAGDLVESWKQYAEGMATVLFCSRVQHSRDAVEKYISEGIPAAHVDADTPDDERDRIFDQLESGAIKVVSNVGIIKEGVDVPCLGCVQFYMDVSGRVAFLQGCGRIMRPYPGKAHGVLIDHAGAVFRHGFPDEDTEWTLEGNVDEKFAKKHDDGETEKVLYCKHCELLYHGSTACPQCGREPAKPPRSIFAPPPIDASNEVLVEADRLNTDVFTQDARIKHWFICLGVAIKRNGSFGMAANIYKRKYGDWPADSFPCMPARHQWREKVSDVYPEFGRKKRASAQA